MAINKAELVPVNSHSFLVEVNGNGVFQTTDRNRASLMVERLNRIFADEKRDLDFLTPTMVNGVYTVCCPPVRQGQGITYLYDRRNPNKHRKERMYDPNHWQDSQDPAEQSAILEVDHSVTPVPWVSALVVANNIRRSIRLNFPDMLGRNECQLLHEPPNKGNRTARVISPRAELRVFGLPCQGRRPGTGKYPCPDFQNLMTENITGPETTYFTPGKQDVEVLHPQDVVTALPAAWYNLYANRFLRITLLESGKSVVVRVNEKGPTGQFVELSYRSWLEIGGHFKRDLFVKVEILGDRPV